MINNNIPNCFNKIIPGLLAISLILAPVAGQTAESQTASDSTQNHNLKSDAPDISGNSKSDKIADPVLEDGATKWLLDMNNNLPGTIDIPQKRPKISETFENQSEIPIVIEADQLSYSDETGSILAKGQVLITSGGRLIEGEEINGNSKLSQVWANMPVSFHDAEINSNFTAEDIFYDYQLNEGHIGKNTGKIDKEYVTGESIDLGREKYIVVNGTITRCPSKIPDYHVSAEKIEIWPGDKMVFHNAKFWIKNKMIFKTNKHTVSLAKNKKTEYSFPRIGYRTSTGIYVRQHMSYYLTQNTSIFANIDYYSKYNFKPAFGIKNEQSNYTVQIVDGHYKDSDDRWIKKSPEFKLDFHPRRLGSTPLIYQLNFSYGKWDDGTKQSWHQNYSIYLNREPVRINETTHLYLGAGAEHIREGYNKSSQNVYRLDATVTKAFSSRLNSWLSYHHKKYKNAPIFSYETPEIEREINYGLTYKLDRLNTIGITFSYDVDNRYHKDINYTWYRNLHCLETAITYKSKPRSWQWDFNIIEW